MASCMLCKKDVTTGFVVCGDCTHTLRAAPQDTEYKHGMFDGELANGIRQLCSLEKNLQGKAETFCEWAQTIYELSADYDEKYSVEVQRLCRAFEEVSHKYGHHIAQQLYNAHTVILATEIRNAARYLSFDGKIDDLPELASLGIFMTEMDAGYIERLVAHMKNGGSVDDIYAIVEERTDHG